MKQVDGDSSAVSNAKTVPVVVIATPSVVNASAVPGLPGSTAKRVRIRVKTFYVILFYPRDAGVPISNFLRIRGHRYLPSAVYIGGSHAPLGRVGSDKPLRLPRLSQWPRKNLRGWRFRLPAPRQPPLVFGIENKFPPPFEFETSARIEPPVAESSAGRTQLQRLLDNCH